MTSGKDALTSSQLRAEQTRYMRLALEEARLAFQMDEVPVGAVLVRGGDVLARSHNLCQSRHDPLLHAEMLCIQEGIRRCCGYLSDCTLYVTLEPCALCAGAALTARLGALVFGAFDARAGCCGSVLDITDHCLHYSFPVWSGVLETECAALLSEFFENKRRTRTGEQENWL